MSKNTKKFLDSFDNKKESKLNRSRENEESDDELVNFVNNYYNKTNCIPMKISIDEAIVKFDEENLKFLKNNKQEKKIINDIKRNMKKTPDNESDFYSNKIIDLIKSMKKTTTKIDLPRLTYGKQLTNDEFINLFEECIKYANYNLPSDEIEKIKSRLLTSHILALKNLFKRGQILKDVIENALLTILTETKKEDQDDNYKLLNIERTTATPILNMNFDNKDEYKLNPNEFIEIFSSPIYLKNYKKTLQNFTDAVPPIQKLKEVIQKHFKNYYVYFCEFPKNIYALAIHTGNIYINDQYLLEFYNEKNPGDQLIIREKIILNIGHELAHDLLREISNKMGENFLIKSNNINKTKSQNIQFKDKFINKFHLLDKNESGNLMDYNFFNNYYFDELYPKEAELFFDIKSIKFIKDYKQRMEEIIKEEKNQKISPNSVNKFKKLNEEPPRCCIRSRILGTILVSEEEYNKKMSESDDSSEDID